MVLSEIDPALNNSADPAAFNLSDVHPELLAGERPADSR